MVFEVLKRNSEIGDGFFAVDIASLSLLIASSSSSSPIMDAGEIDGIVGIRTPIKKSISKKGSHAHSGREGMASESAAGDRERTSVLIDVASEDESSAVFPVKTPTTNIGASSRCRHASSRRPSPWLRPRRVLVLFASLSSMGTLILLYFTLSMGKMTSSNINV